MDNSQLEKQGGDSERKQEHQDEGKRQFPFPLLWMPHDLDDVLQNEDYANTNAGEECIKENPKVMVIGAEEKQNAPEVKEINLDGLKTLEKNKCSEGYPCE